MIERSLSSFETADLEMSIDYVHTAICEGKPAREVRKKKNASEGERENEKGIEMNRESRRESRERDE